MADTFGLKIGLEGEKEFKKALAEINQSFKVLGSEMKLVESQFDKNDNSIESLTARNQVLNKEIEAQKQKIETLKSALANAAESFGENDRRTQQWQIQLNNAQAALNSMERELADNESAMDALGKEMDDTGESADDLSEDIDDAGDAADDSEGKFSKLGGTLKTVGVAMGAVVAAAATAAVALGKSVIEAYGEYEQLVGGVDTLFKDSSQQLQDYTNNAYKTAGMSANDYMETVTGFSASLIQSLGGDTEAAVKYADMAITDMADNANKMGTDIGMIQSAYQGFAKQNYTMLDNLKLGYGGTKTEMERLLADATAISGIEYDLSSYADIVSAIHVIQESLGVAGATAAEAEYTIEGSINSMKAAISNLVVGFGNADADIEQLCKNVTDAFQNVLTNITPVIENIIAALPTALNALLATMGELLPALLDTVVDLFSQVLTTLLGLIPQLMMSNRPKDPRNARNKNVFNHRTNVDIQSRIVSYDIKELGKQLKKIGMLIVQDQVWNRVTVNRAEKKSTRYYIDEMHLLLKEEQTAAYSVEIWKRFRKWGGIPTGITQNVKDLLSSREVENIFENSDYIYMLNQASGDRQILAKHLNISPHQLSYVTHSGEGEGLLFYGSVILPFVDRFPKDTELYRIMTTKLSETSETEVA